MLKPVSAQTPDDYIAQIEEPRRSAIEKLHRLILTTAPSLKPSMQAGMIGYGAYRYKYASGREGTAPIVALASQKSYISVYVSASDEGGYCAERRKAELPKASIGKCCIRFKKLEDLQQRMDEQLNK